MGVDDDFSYIMTAQKFAQTGHFFYNGWGNPILGWQVPWGALFIHLFGSSYTPCRFSIVVVALLTTFLLHRTLQRCGIQSWNASIATLLLMLTPIFFPLIPTFMTDVPGVFAIVVCLYACLRAIEARSERAALIWLCAAAASNLALGTVRQISWLGVLVMVPSTAWLLRKWKWALPVGAGLWLAGVLGILFFMHWFAGHPYSVPEHIVEGPIQRSMLVKALSLLVRSVATLALLSQPILVAFFSPLSERRTTGLA
jgi:4-amino-4-deoxy-L-arabinose transferase-like glycosyltransferase